MKKILLRSLTSFFAVTMLFVACTKEDKDVTLESKLATSETTKIFNTSATVIGFVVSTGSGISEKGVCYSTSPEPTIAGDKVIFTADSVITATFEVTLTGLDFATKYYARAYAITVGGVLYGEELSFTTLPNVPTVTTAVFTAMSGTTAQGGGEVSDDGRGAITQRGVCYSVLPNPTLEHCKDSITSDGKAVGTFTSSISKLKQKTKYYVKAFATNSGGTGYGTEVSFTTPASIVKLYAAGAFQGWDPAAAKDSLMNTETDPIVRGFIYFPAAGEFKFVAQKSWTGTAYGLGSAAGILSTAADAGNLSVPSAGYYQFAIDMINMTYTAIKTDWGIIGSGTAGGWDSDQNMTYSAFFRSWFATIPLTAGEIKFRANDGWDINFGGPDGKLTAGGDNIAVSTAGTYSVMMNLSSPNNYKYSVTQWGIIGSATAGGWDSDQNMTPNANNTWTITANLTVGEFKFRANDGWDINLGGTPSNISWGGDNIVVSTAGTYTITLDLVNGTYTIL
ncbi:SusF/SusE family outer membrane protein [Williamwhitmania taraxaci]|uniref:SusE outer membrane protein n=1 Tax=Williamwhitmania taraxaci TaxID=1640674 RepID=A0A1G6HTF9_9BACT|nr:SusF/SusE family outer membrane protein [Williamwhitmania taraxaci]SDB97522.1 protein of unknown function [Williamwhitmania taraxaci]